MLCLLLISARQHNPRISIHKISPPGFWEHTHREAYYRHLLHTRTPGDVWNTTYLVVFSCHPLEIDRWYRVLSPLFLGAITFPGSKESSERCTWSKDVQQVGRIEKPTQTSFTPRLPIISTMKTYVWLRRGDHKNHLTVLPVIARQSQGAHEIHTCVPSEYVHCAHKYLRPKSFSSCASNHETCHAKPWLPRCRMETNQHRRHPSGPLPSQPACFSIRKGVSLLEETLALQLSQVTPSTITPRIILCSKS